MSAGGTNSTDQASNADWSAYATAYDLLSKHNPEYKALMQEFEDFLTGIDTPKIIYDVGGGTGNYTEIAARLCPDSSICLQDIDRHVRRRRCPDGPSRRGRPSLPQGRDRHIHLPLKGHCREAVGHGISPWA